MDRYPLPDASKNVLLVLAGNIPMVGLHDILCTYVSGHRAVIKPSRDDTALITAAPTQCLQEAEPSLARPTDARPRTGPGRDRRSDRHRQRRYPALLPVYFRQIPALLRHARYSVGLITEDTSQEELEQLADRHAAVLRPGLPHVTQVLVPEDFDLSRLGRALGKYASIADHPNTATITTTAGRCMP